MRVFVCAKRTAKEVVRDPLNIGLGLGLPIILLVMMSIMQQNLPIKLFEIQNIAPGIAAFALSFMTVFAATIVAKDRSSALLQRLYTTPLKSSDFILGYTLPIIPIALAQSIICFLVAFIFKLEFSVNLLYALAAIVPVAMFYISLGLLCGSVLNIKAVGGICGTLITNLAALLGGVWFDLSLLGDGFNTFAHLLPFANAYELVRGVLNASYVGTIWNFLWVLGYCIVAMIGSVLLFLRQMKKQ